MAIGYTINLSALQALSQFATLWPLICSHQTLVLGAGVIHTSDETCVYSFTVPRGSSGDGCQGHGQGQGPRSGGCSAVDEDVEVLKETVRSHRDQLTALMTQQSLLMKEITEHNTDNGFVFKHSRSTTTTTTTASLLSTLFHGASPPTSGRTSGSGVTYIRWGRTTCPGEATSLYKGYAASNHFFENVGGGGNYLCLPETPQWGNVTNGFQGGSRLYGVEYDMLDGQSPFSTSNIIGQQFRDHDAPCVLCHAEGRSSVTMIPARVDCPSGWTREYWGYLVSSNQAHKNTKNYECLDVAPEVVAGGIRDTNGALFYHVEAACGALPCPKYVDGWEIACVVCSK